jgi:hypothetical protein
MYDHTNLISGRMHHSSRTKLFSNDPGKQPAPFTRH